MKDNSTEYVKVTYYSNCVGDGPLRQTNRCAGLKVGSRVKFTAKIEVVKCPKDPREWHQVFQIYPVGINEAVLVDLTMMCQCECEKPGNPVSILKSWILFLEWESNQIFKDFKKARETTVAQIWKCKQTFIFTNFYRVLKIVKETAQTNINENMIFGIIAPSNLDLMHDYDFVFRHNLTFLIDNYVQIVALNLTFLLPSSTGIYWKCASMFRPWNLYVWHLSVCSWLFRSTLWMRCWKSKLSRWLGSWMQTWQYNDDALQQSWRLYLWKMRVLSKRKSQWGL